MVKHYNGTECLEAMRAQMTPEQFKGFLKGNIIKYIWRSDTKGIPINNLEKAQTYLEWWKEMEKNGY